MIFVWYIGLGCNVNRSWTTQFQKAAANVGGTGLVLLTLPVVRSAAWVADIGPFVNSCIKLVTLNNAITLLAFLKTVERRCGRRPSPRWLRRAIDIDIVWSSVKISIYCLAIPHVFLIDRRFAAAFAFIISDRKLARRLLCVIS